jgi:hypothetical protein
MINTMIRITTRVPTPMYIEYPSSPLVDGLALRPRPVVRC